MTSEEKLEKDDDSFSIKIYIEKIQYLFDIVKSVIIGLSVIILFIIAIINIIRQLNDDKLKVDAFSVSQELSEQGYTGEIIAQRIMDNYFKIYKNASTLKDIRDIAPKWGLDDVLIDIPIEGISMASIQTIIKMFFGITSSKISGEILKSDTNYLLTARFDSNLINVSNGSIEGLIKDVSEQIIFLTDPYVMASYFFSTDSISKCNHIVDSIIYATSKNRANKDKLYWFYLLKGRIEQSRKEYNKAIELFNKALKNKKMALGYYNIGVVYGKNLKNLSLAIAYADTSILYDYKMWDAYMLGEIYCLNYADSFIERSNSLIEKSDSLIKKSDYLKNDSITSNKLLDSAKNYLNKSTKYCIKYQDKLLYPESTAQSLVETKMCIYYKTIVRAQKRYGDKVLEEHENLLALDSMCKEKNISMSKVYNYWYTLFLLNLSQAILIDTIQQKFKKVDAMKFAKTALELNYPELITFTKNNYQNIKDSILRNKYREF